MDRWVLAKFTRLWSSLHIFSTWWFCAAGKWKVRVPMSCCEKEKSGADEKESHLLSLTERARSVRCRCVSKYESRSARCTDRGRDPVERERETPRKKANCHTRRDDDFISKTTHAQTHFCKSDRRIANGRVFFDARAIKSPHTQPLFQFRAASIIARLISECVLLPGPPSPLALVILCD